jgi:hypothetical protein
LALATLAAALGVWFGVQMVSAAPLGRLSDRDVATAWRTVASRLGPPGTKVLLNRGFVDITLPQWVDFVGLFDAIQGHGYRPQVDAFWATWVGSPHLADRRDPVRVMLYGRSSRTERLPGYVGHTRYEDIVVTYATPRTAPSP